MQAAAAEAADMQECERQIPAGAARQQLGARQHTYSVVHAHHLRAYRISHARLVLVREF